MNSLPKETIYDPVLLPDSVAKKTVNVTGANVVYTPEPTTLSLLGLGAIGLMARRRKSAPKKA
jgi:hypothetical protein